MRGIRSHKKRLLKKYKWSSEFMDSFTVTGPYERSFVKYLMRWARSSRTLKSLYKKSPDTYHDELYVAMRILLYTMPSVLESGCALTPTKYNKRMRAKSEIKNETQ